MKKYFLTFVFLFVTLFALPQKASFLVQGSEYQNFFKTYCVYKQYNYLIQYTSKESIKKFGKERIIKLYSNLKVEPKRKWEYVNVIVNGNRAQYFFTISLQGATTKTVHFDLIKEEGKWKILIPQKINSFLKS